METAQANWAKQTDPLERFDFNLKHGAPHNALKYIIFRQRYVSKA
ncbi:hypothetical protein [Pseudorhodobacter ferrugineus]|nr:hypothetical protein [Pseudorhodobacter ferrugineus]